MKITMVLLHAGSTKCFMVILSQVLLTVTRRARCLSVVTVPFTDEETRALKGSHLLRGGGWGFEFSTLRLAI